MNGLLATLLPWKEVIGGVVGFLSAGAAIVAAILKQRRAPDATFTEQATYQSRTWRLHPDDRDAMGGLRESLGDVREGVSEMTRAVRHLSGLMADEAEGRERQARHVPNGGRKPRPGRS